MSDWYRISNKVSIKFQTNPHHQDLQDIGGDSILRHNNFSPFQLLSTAYPDYNWLPWKFQKTPQKFWDNLKNQRNFMEWAGNELKIKEITDWYKITAKVIFFTLKNFKLRKK